MAAPMTDDLTAFILARVGEQQEWAELWGHDRESHQEPCPACRPFVLAWCAAVRQVVELWNRRWEEAEQAEEQHVHRMLASQATGLGTAARAIASMWRDHEDYRAEEWA